MDLKPQSVLQGVAGAVMLLAIVAGAQTPSAPAPAPTTAPAAAPAASPTWSVGPVDFSGYLDGYYSYNANRPADELNGIADYDTESIVGYNFDDADQFNLEAAKLTLNHDPDPIGAHVDLIFGRTNAFLHPGYTEGTSSDGSGVNYIEQAYISVKPAKAKGFELDMGQFVTSAGQEVIETMNNWSYSHGLLFTYAIPYYHFGLRTSMPFTKSWTGGVQVVNGWNNVTDNNGGVTFGFTSSVVKTKYTWNLNYYVGPENAGAGYPGSGGVQPSYLGTQMGYRNLIDTTLLLTPSSKFNFYINYDYTQNRIPSYTYQSCDETCSTVTVKTVDPHVQGLAVSARVQMTGKSALVGRYEYFADQGSTVIGTGTKQTLEEFTGTYEYKWLEGLLFRAEYRYDWSSKKVFSYGNDLTSYYGNDSPTKTDENTATVGVIAFFGPKR